MLNHINLSNLFLVKDSKLVRRWLHSHIISSTTLTHALLNSKPFLDSRRLFSKNVDHYKVLGVSRNATRQEIKLKYYEKCKKLHPDRLGGEEANTEEFLKIKTAYDILSSKKSRLDYDSYSRSPDKQSKSFDDWLKYNQHSRQYGNINTNRAYGFKYDTQTTKRAPSRSFYFDIFVILCAGGMAFYMVRHEIRMTSLGFGTITNQIRGHGTTRNREQELLYEKYHYTQQTYNQPPSTLKNTSSETSSHSQPSKDSVKHLKKKTSIRKKKVKSKKSKDVSEENAQEAITASKNQGNDHINQTPTSSFGPTVLPAVALTEPIISTSIEADSNIVTSNTDPSIHTQSSNIEDFITNLESSSKVVERILPSSEILTLAKDEFSESLSLTSVTTNTLCPGNVSSSCTSCTPQENQHNKEKELFDILIDKPPPNSCDCADQDPILTTDKSSDGVEINVSSHDNDQSDCKSDTAQVQSLRLPDEMPSSIINIGDLRTW